MGEPPPVPCSSGEDCDFAKGMGLRRVVRDSAIFRAVRADGSHVGPVIAFWPIAASLTMLSVMSNFLQLTIALRLLRERLLSFGRQWTVDGMRGEGRPGGGGKRL